MIEHNIALAHLIPNGQVECALKDNALHITIRRAIPTQRFDVEHLSINSFLCSPEKYRLPLTIDITAKIDAPR